MVVCESLEYDAYDPGLDDDLGSEHIEVLPLDSFSEEVFNWGFETSCEEEIDAEAERVFGHDSARYPEGDLSDDEFEALLRQARDDVFRIDLIDEVVDETIYDPYIQAFYKI
eukprot:Blabericola_migrator_1__11136@NODE_651_length_7047_cov_201_880372_g477_i0_p7_GENE_NODE_651_length_7047_cov_201_880372_g477_i0NODE_651_length_7047_cov_201_880372_g477_i0_p7_ORF_typecomplete_len112_score24_90GSG1/PF07803_11/0_31_NODE_651_length_7047_cov_201_880372_g477_i029103245